MSKLIEKIKFLWSPKAIWSMKTCNAFINIWEGAVRSSKTVASTVAFLEFVERSEHREFLMTGKTESTCYRNIIGGKFGILNIMGKRAKFQKSGDGGTRLELKFPNPDRKGKKDKWIVKVCYVVGANDEKSEAKIRGMTIAGWYADEITLYPESFVKQAINRMSLDGAQAYWTTNPDSPYHYIKTEFIDKAKEKGYKVFHFELDDNPALSERYKDNLKAAYKGLWFKRMVLGLWVMAEGVIYDMFNHDPIRKGGMVGYELPKMLRYWVGVDYGQSNATTFILIGESEDGKFWIIDEWYHSGRDSETNQFTPSQYAKQFKKWIESFHYENGTTITVEKIFIDPSAKGFILELYGILDGQMKRKIQAAFNDVKVGIENFSTMIGADQVRVHYTCKNVLRELASYIWDHNAQKRGEDKPVKENDHTMDGVRYVAIGTRQIWELKRKQAA